MVKVYTVGPLCIEFNNGIFFISLICRRDNVLQSAAAKVSTEIGIENDSLFLKATGLLLHWILH